MRKTLKEKWLKALRSGEYRQGNGHLLDTHGNYCCLGVLACVAGVPPEKILERGDLTSIGRNDLLGSWDGNEENPEDFDKEVKSTHTTVQRKLAAMNDNGRTFRQIASYIEKHIPTGRQKKPRRAATSGAKS